MAKKPVKQNPVSSYEVPLTDLLEAGCHFGHQAQRWHPKMAQYIWQKRDGVHIFDLSLTSKKLKEACLAVKEMVSQGKTIVFVGTKRQAQAIIKEEAEKSSMPYVSNRWLGGTITNWEQIKKSLDKLMEMREKQVKGDYKIYTKKENLLLQREIDRLNQNLGGLVDLKKIPDALFIIDCKREIAALKEAKLKGVIIFAIVDSNTDPELIDYLIPANDDALRSIKLITATFAKAVAEGVSLRKENSNGSEKQPKKN